MYSDYKEEGEHVSMLPIFCRKNNNYPEIFVSLRRFLKRNNMEIIVRKPTAQEVLEMKSNPVWTCGVSEFEWHYDREETCLIIEGDVTVKYGSKSVSFTAGDFVVFPKGLSCVWNVEKPVSKYYIFK